MAACTSLLIGRQHTSIGKLTPFFQRFEAKEHILRDDKTKVIGDNTLNLNYFESEINHESSNNKKFLFFAFFGHLWSVPKPVDHE